MTVHHTYYIHTNILQRSDFTRSVHKNIIFIIIYHLTYLTSAAIDIEFVPYCTNIITLPISYYNI